MLLLTDDMLTGIDKIDAQHRSIVARMNHILSLEDGAYSKEETKKTLDFLASYLIIHFNDEEQLMLQSGYKNYYVHKQQHKVLLDKFHEFKIQLYIDGYTDGLALKLNGKLIHWIVTHIMIDDVEFGRHYAGKK
ncbi:MAG: hemerythrin family protein [Defluviitaleaceae bacterium]|nr:hemerythrin family protein [Defluviitaleaceae bacterium]